GRIIKPHGIRGELAVESLSDVVGRFEPGAVLTDRRGRTFTVTTSRPHQGRLLLGFEEVPDRTEAERLRGVELLAEPVDPSDSETYFVHELVGMRVVDEEDAELGRVSDVIDLPATAGYDLLEVERPDGSTWLLPAVDEYVHVDVTGDEEFLRLVEPPEGLVDDSRRIDAGGPS
ncbi:MAG: ribosome maturation factor RimM, partial [Nitriliruptorales bacterium]|nr:ribosome maturation factor RimM [Nitriliruptorales bacterium]